ncbi:hypothetical protein HY745_03745 [Candidatus Desantisbacteria bacterium]|nr:hypothetical protein [Candidatus Desantisbacteria bacterium]
MRKIYLVTIVFSLIFTTLVIAQNVELCVRVCENEVSDTTGISNLKIKLIPPKTVNKPEIIATTDARGNFCFQNLEKSRYLLEIYQGITLLYREVTDANQDTKKEIILRKENN